MQPLVSVRVTEKYPFSSKENWVGSILGEAGLCTRKTSSLTRLNDVLRKTLLQEAKRNARSNELVLSSEREPNSKPNRCAVKRRSRESGARLTKQGGREGGREGGNIFIL